MRIVRSEINGRYNVFFKYKDSSGTWRSCCKRSFPTEDAAVRYVNEYIAAKKGGKADAHHS
ncbi:Arm DNA-binding domain-containing protein [Paratractidigestivibacter sp.]|uniref:Arm DNA-binding domain-containing protein n=1 Tax=Paratractidigestivibacter sp. TaxID=2847316 RepID=UPI002AC9F0CC|nr:Arm DNA-binding domain-containing protein [Paratractidigestivibacter sp.]